MLVNYRTGSEHMKSLCDREVCGSALNDKGTIHQARTYLFAVYELSISFADFLSSVFILLPYLMISGNENSGMLFVPGADPGVIGVTDWSYWVRTYKSDDSSETVVYVVILAQKLSDSVKSITGSNQPDATIKVIWFNVILPNIFGELPSFLSRNICCVGVVFDRGVEMHAGLINTPVIRDCDVLGDIDVDHSNFQFDSVLNVGLCGIELYCE